MKIISAPSSCACSIVELSVAAVGDDQSHDLARLGFGASKPSSVPSAAQSKGSELFSHFFLLPLLDEDDLIDDGVGTATAASARPRGGQDDASVWDLRDERRVRKFRLFDGERVKGFDRATYTLRGLAIGGSGRLVGVSNTNRVDDATMQLVRGDRRMRCEY